MGNVGRDANGKWIRLNANESEICGIGCDHEVGQRKDTSKERSARAGASGSNGCNSPPRREKQRESTKNIKETAEKVYFHAVVCAWITAAVYVLVKIAFWIVFFFFIRSITDENVIGSFTKTAISCFRGKTGGCYSKLVENFFPLDQNTENYRVSFRIADSGLASAAVIYEVGFPLLPRNPVVLSLTLLAITVIHFILGYTHSLLVDIADTADAADPQQALGEIYGHPSLYFK